MPPATQTNNHTTESDRRTTQTDSVIVYQFRDRYKKADTIFIHDSVAKVVVRLKTDTLLKADTITSSVVEYVQTPAKTPRIITGLAYTGGIAIGILLLVIGIFITKIFI